MYMYIKDSIYMCVCVAGRGVPMNTGMGTDAMHDI